MFTGVDAEKRDEENKKKEKEASSEKKNTLCLLARNWSK